MEEIKKKRVSPARHWILTIHKYNLDQMYHWMVRVEDGDLAPIVETVVAQEERGKKSGKLHIQMYLVFRNEKRRPSAADFPWGKKCWSQKAYTPQKAAKYCNKLMTATGMTWIHGWSRPYEYEVPMAGLTPHPWQQEILAHWRGEVADHRTIFWVYGTKGNEGKSSLMDRGAHIMGNMFFNLDYAKPEDCLYTLINHIQDNQVQPKVIAIDVKRNQPLDYHFLESLKNKCWTSGKYKSKRVVWNKQPQVWVFANCPPVPEALSLDRWCIARIQDDKSLLFTTHQ